MGMNGLLAQHNVDIERKLNDLESRSESLRRNGTPPMNWHEFQRTDQAAAVKPTCWSWGSALSGGGIGGMVAIGGALLLSAMSTPIGIGILGAGIIGLLVGGSVSGFIPNKDDRREAMIGAFEKYLDSFEKSPQKRREMPPTRGEEVPSPLPTSRIKRKVISADR